MILLGPSSPVGDLTALGERLPVVAVGRRLPIDTLDVVRCADSRGIAAAVDHLAELGHERIVHIAGGSGSIQVRPARRIPACDAQAQFRRFRCGHRGRFHRVGRVPLQNSFWQERPCRPL